MAIPKNFNDDHYFMFPGTVWRAFETGVLDEEFFPTVMRPVVRFVTRSPVAPNNPMPSPLPQIEGLIEEHQLLKRIYRQRSGDDETAAIGELGEAISAVDVFADIPVLMAKALAGGISLEGAGEALSIGAAGLFLRSLGGNPMDVHLHTSINLRRYLLRLDGISLKNKLMLLLTWQSGPEIRSTANSHGALPAARHGSRCRAAAADAGGVARRDQAQHLQPAADRLVQGDQSRARCGRCRRSRRR